jgi:hypothetical protein
MVSSDAAGWQAKRQIWEVPNQTPCTINCDRCHNGNIRTGTEKFAAALPSMFPSNPFGNGIDWSQSYRERLLTPASFLSNHVSWQRATTRAL